jgi:hypothetical protein
MGDVARGRAHSRAEGVVVVTVVDHRWPGAIDG